MFDDDDFPYEEPAAPFDLVRGQLGNGLRLDPQQEEAAYAEPIGVNLVEACAGSGKCVLPDTLVAVNGQLVPIHEVWSNFKTLEFFDGEGFVSEPASNLMVDSYDETTGRFVRKPVEALYKQNVLEAVRAVHLSDGTILHLTKAHKLFNGFSWTNIFNPGDTIAVPGSLTHGADQIDPELAEFFGWWVGEGCELVDPNFENNVTYALTLKKQAEVQAVVDLVDRLEAKYSDTHARKTIKKKHASDAYVVRFNNRKFHEKLKSAGFTACLRAGDKEVPSSVMGADASTVKVFLMAYFDGEGHANSNNKTVEVTSASYKLATQIQYLLRRFGVWARMKVVSKYASNTKRKRRRLYYTLYISGPSLRTFAEAVNFGMERKRVALERMIKSKCNPNVDLLPSSPVLEELVESTGLNAKRVGNLDARYCSTRNTSRETYQNSLRPHLVALASKVGEKLRGNQFHQTKLMTVSQGTAVCEAIKKLDRLAGQELFYAKVVKVEEYLYSGFVYDLTVADTHNFVAQNILCHNSTMLKSRVPYILRYRDEHFDTGSKVLALMFGKKNAQELDDYFTATLTDSDRARVVVKTFHSIAGTLLYKFRGASKVTASNIERIKSHHLIQDYCDYTRRRGMGFTPKQVKGLLWAQEEAQAKDISVDDVIKRNLRFFREKMGMAPDDVSGYVYDFEDWRYKTGKLVFNDYMPLATQLPPRCFKAMNFNDIVVDEVQDLNAPQRGIVKNFMAHAQSVTAVGDRYQCFIPGTQVETSTGSKAIETIQIGDLVKTATGKGQVGFGAVTKLHQNFVKKEVLRITTESGRSIVCTPEHALFTRTVPDVDTHYVYLMYREGFGFRIGVTRGYRYHHTMESGLAIRAIGEKADALWVLRSTKTRSEALTYEQLYAIKYSIPDVCFNVANYKDWDEQGVWLIFNSIDTISNARALAADLGIDLGAPHWVKSHGQESIAVTYMAVDRYECSKKHHRVGWETDDETAVNQLTKAGLKTRKAKPFADGRPRYRVSTTKANYADAYDLAKACADAANLRLVQRFDLLGSKNWTLTPASGVFPSQEVPISGPEGLEIDHIVSVTREMYEGFVYDFNVDTTHNYTANGIYVHNSIFGFCGADDKIFEKLKADYPGSRSFPMHYNYRSTDQILELVNRVLEFELESTMHIAGTGRQGPPPLLYTDGAAGLLSWLEMRHESGEAWKDIAILYRSKLCDLAELEVSLATSGIPYVLHDGGFFEENVVQDMIAYFNVLYHPKPVYGDWRRIFQHVKGIGDSTAEEVWEATNGKPLNWRSGVPTTVGRIGRETAWREFWDDLKAFKTVADSSISELTDDLILMLTPGWDKAFGDASPHYLADRLRLADVFREWVNNFGPAAKGWDVVQAIELIESGNRKNDETTDAVQIMSGHKSKGMQFNSCAVWCVSEGKFPMNQSTSDPGEERRLGYVVLSRAKTHLALICPKPGDRSSTFAKHVPEAHVQLDQLLQLEQAV